MTEKMKSFVKGILLGLCGHPLPQGEPTPPQGEPVAYLYNGVRLPKLPEWDRVKYPFSVVRSLTGTTVYADFYARCSNTPVRIPGTSSVGLPLDEMYPYKVYKLETEWELVEETDKPVTRFVAPKSIIWANFDVLNEDGTVYLAASEPVPIYE